MSYRLPNGQTTNNGDEYFTAWRKVYEFMEKMIGGGAQCMGYDPGLLFRIPGNYRGLELPVWLCLQWMEKFGCLFEDKPQPIESKVEEV